MTMQTFVVVLIGITLGWKLGMATILAYLFEGAIGLPVFAGTGSNSTEEAISLTTHAEKMGADGALIVTPYYNKPTQEGLYQHYKAINDKCGIPILIYNIPGRSVIDMSVETMARLFELKNIEGRYIITNNSNKLSINGTFLDHSFLFGFEQNQNNNSSLSLKVPSLNLSTNLFYKKDDISNKKDGTLNFQILDNLIFFKFLEEKEILIEEGYIRNNLLNSSLQGSLSFNPNFIFKLNLDLNYLRFIKFFEFLKKHLFFDNSESLEFFKKANGTLVISKMPDSLIVFENNDIRFSNIILDKEKNINLNGKITEYGSKGKIQFDITKETEVSKRIVIGGVILPYASKIHVNEIYKENKNYSKEDMENYEDKINNEIIKKNLNNIFDVNVIDNLINELN